jgi:hypothetical protein
MVLQQGANDKMEGTAGHFVRKIGSPKRQNTPRTDQKLLANSDHDKDLESNRINMLAIVID